MQCLLLMPSCVFNQNTPYMNEICEEIHVQVNKQVKIINSTAIIHAYTILFELQSKGNFWQALCSQCYTCIRFLSKQIFQYSWAVTLQIYQDFQVPVQFHFQFSVLMSVMNYLHVLLILLSTWFNSMILMTVIPETYRLQICCPDRHLQSNYKMNTLGSHESKVHHYIFSLLRDVKQL